MTRKSKNKRSKTTMTKEENDKVVVEETPPDKAVEGTVVAEESETNHEPSEKEEETEVVVNDKDDDEEKDEQMDEASSKKRSLDEANMEEEDGDHFLNLGKAVLDWITSPVVNTLGSFFRQIVGTTATPAEPEEGPPAIDGVISMMVLGSDQTSLLQSAWLDPVSVSGSGDTNNSMTVKEYKKDFAFETLVGETKTIHSVRLQLYDCYGVDPTEEEEEESVEESKDNTAWDNAVQSVQTIVLVLPVTQNPPELVAALETWTTWIREQFQHVTKQPEIVLLVTTNAAKDEEESDWLSEDTALLHPACHTRGISSWHFLSSSSSDSPNAVSSIDDLLHSLVQRRSQPLKPLVSSNDTEDSKPSPKRRRVG